MVILTDRKIPSIGCKTGVTGCGARPAAPRVDVERIGCCFCESDRSIDPNPRVVDGVSEVDERAPKTEWSGCAVIPLVDNVIINLEELGCIDHGARAGNARRSARESGVHAVI